MTNNLLFLLVGAVVAGVMMWLVTRQRLAWLAPVGPNPDAIRLEAELAAARERIAEWQRANSDFQMRETRLQESLAELQRDNAALQATVEAERRDTKERLALLQSAREEMANQFRVLATDLLEQKSAKFTEVSETTIKQLLTPFHGDLLGLKEKVEGLHLEDARDRAALKEQLRQMMEATGNLHEDAANLTKALKGDAKVQGDYGEMLLDQILDSVNFIEGVNYTRQGQQRDADGNRLIPDIVVHMPQDRHVVVDSKVSLAAYVDAIEADNESARTEALDRHVASVRAHIKELGDKNYLKLYGLSSLDYVLMFIPNDGAFLQAVAADRELTATAWKQNVVLVSPNTLLFTLRTIEHMWRIDAQNRNALNIADRATKMLDKVIGFATDLTKIGDALQDARDCYDDACKKLNTGRGNLASQLKTLQELGVKGQKAMPLILEPGDDHGSDNEDGRLLATPG